MQCFLLSLWVYSERQSEGSVVLYCYRFMSSVSPVKSADVQVECRGWVICCNYIAATFILLCTLLLLHVCYLCYRFSENGANLYTLMAARMVSAVHQTEHITAVHEDLHWLPVSQLVFFKTALMVVKCVHGVAPAYSDLCVPATACHLRSSASAICSDLYWFRTATGQRSFAVNGPATWNRLPPALRSCRRAPSSGHWKRSCSRPPRRHWDLFMILAPDINIQTFYLLTFFVKFTMFLTNW